MQFSQLDISQLFNTRFKFPTNPLLVVRRVLDMVPRGARWVIRALLCLYVPMTHAMI